MAVEDLRMSVRPSELNDREILADSLAEFPTCERNLRGAVLRRGQ
jgi:hypothetical protein